MDKRGLEFSFVQGYFLRCRPEWNEGRGLKSSEPKAGSRSPIWQGLAVLRLDVRQCHQRLCLESPLHFLAVGGVCRWLSRRSSWGR